MIKFAGSVGFFKPLPGWACKDKDARLVALATGRTVEIVSGPSVCLTPSPTLGRIAGSLRQPPESADRAFIKAWRARED